METNIRRGMALSLYHLILGSFICIIFCTLSIDASSILSREDQLKRITKYEIITPQRLDGRQRRHADTLLEDGHLKEPTFIIPIQGEEYILDLHKNDMLFADGYVERTYAAGNIPTNKLPHRTHHCYYHGEVRGSNFSRVALSTCKGLSGIIFLDSLVFYLEPLQGSSMEHVLYQPEHVLRDKPWHTFEEDYPKDFLEKGEERLQEMEERHKERVRRDSNTETKYIELVMVADSKETSYKHQAEFVEYFHMEENIYEKRGTVRALEERIKAIVNIMDMIYLALNTRVVLAAVIVWQTDPFEVSSNPSTALGQFQRWREDELVSLISHDNAQLITGLNFDGSTVGMAALSTMCSRDRSCGVSQDHGNHENDVASTISHEMGHNLGLVHDVPKDCECQSVQNIGCVMSASSGSNPPLNWSSCSVDAYQINLDRGLGACMFNYPKLIFGGPTCQNGFLEAGEECDCGPADLCDNPCCVAETCRLHENATCASGACCDNCQLKQRGQLCRDMMNQCDLPEYCTGNHEECPANVYRQNGVSCRSDVSIAASCFNGMCMSYDQQCKFIWGTSAQVAHSKCWRYNQQGTAFGNCGIQTSGSPVACSKSDRMCGKLLCEGGENFPLLGSLAEASQGYIFDQNGQRRACKAASLDLGEDVPDPGYVADGSPCTDNMFCYERKCINSSRAGITQCPENCNNNGICNSENHCHCNDNWAPPTCGAPGNGGSVDSGPTMPITPDILTTVKLETPRHSTPTTRLGSSGPSDSAGPTPTTTTFSDFPGTKLPATNTVVIIVLGVILMAAVVLLALFVYWKRNSIRRKLRCKRLNSPSHPPPAKPRASPTSPTVLKIQHPAHISEAPPSYESHYSNYQEQISPARVAPEPPSKEVQQPPPKTWNNGPLVVPSAPPVKYQKHDDKVMYDEPPNVDFVDPAIPRFNPLPPLMSTNHVPSSSQAKRPDLVPLAEEAVEPSINRYSTPSAPPAPPVKPNQSKPLKPTLFDGVVLKPTHTAPKPPSIKPVEQEQTVPSNSVALRPPGKAQATPPLKPPGQNAPKPPVQAPPKPPGQVALKPPGQTPLKPHGQTPLKPPVQMPLKPPGQTPPPPRPLSQEPQYRQPPPELPPSKPAPASRKPVVPGKPSVPDKPSVASKPGVPSKPNKRPALRPPGTQENCNNSANSPSSTTTPHDERLDEPSEANKQSDGHKPQPTPLSNQSRQDHRNQ